MRKGDVSVFSFDDNWFTNSYTYDASVLVVAFASIVNDCHAFANSTEPLDSLEAEIRCVRLYTENVLYTARLCEAFIKQLLFCSSFPEEDYHGSALGSLLSKDCNSCRPNKEKRHKISLLGSLAHRYHLCHSYELCLNEHVKIVNRRRDIEAAHSGVTKLAQKFVRKPVSEIRKKFEKECLDLGNSFIHMLHHISDLEDKMLAELNHFIREEAQRVCPAITFSQSQDIPSHRAES